MVDAAPRSALAGNLTPGRFGAAGEPGVAISEVRGRSLVYLAGDADRLESGTGMDLPKTAGEVTEQADTRVLWLGPDRWLLVAPPSPFGAWVERLEGKAPQGAFNEVTFGRTTLRLQGASARDVLAKGCPLDLDARAFGPGQCAQSLLGHLNVLLECRADHVFEVTVTRSYGADLLDWLKRAAAEYGFQISA